MPKHFWSASILLALFACDGREADPRPQPGSSQRGAPDNYAVPASFDGRHILGHAGRLTSDDIVEVQIRTARRTPTEQQYTYTVKNVSPHQLRISRFGHAFYDAALNSIVQTELRRAGESLGLSERDFVLMPGEVETNAASTMGHRGLPAQMCVYVDYVDEPSSVFVFYGLQSLASEDPTAEHADQYRGAIDLPQQWLDQGGLTADDRTIRIGTMIAIAGAGDRGIPHLIRAFEQKGEVMTDAAAVMAKEFGEAAIPHLLKALESEDDGVQSGSVIALGLIDSAQEGVIVGLLKAMGSRHYHVRHNARVAVRQLGSRALPTLRMLARHPDASVRSNAREMLNDLER